MVAAGRYGDEQDAVAGGGGDDEVVGAVACTTRTGRRGGNGRNAGGTCKRLRRASKRATVANDSVCSRHMKAGPRMAVVAPSEGKASGFSGAGTAPVPAIVKAKPSGER